MIDGEKAFITNSGTPITSLVTVTARTGPRARSATIVVPAGTPGFEVQPPYRKMGWHASDTHGLTFDDCRVPAGPPARRARARASPSFLAILDDGRIAIAALAVGVIRGLPRAVPSRTPRSAHAFGRPIGANQAVAFKCADLAVARRDARTS